MRARGALNAMSSLGSIEDAQMMRFTRRHASQATGTSAAVIDMSPNPSPTSKQSGL